MDSAVQRQYVEFGVDNEHYAIPISDVHEIIRMQEITDIPNGRHYVKGIINLRGRIVPVLSLRVLLAMDEVSSTKHTRILVVHHLEEAIGVIVDKVNKVTTFNDIQPAPDSIAGISGSFFNGVGFSSSELVGILKLDEILLRN
ncbi:chemotaxis protein CheW [Paenibacillus sp. MMS20-IR301]|uniref:chemotaxis protein CheW n=1 Tax=Paenibacillus sp. MMS20-IR301 TaxID=2895946 RepID=UPI0028E9AF84|nr:chemotaxis protein CheW [Paenibacillus sp. MMS20-IR301]WNS41728.1 chemotaxis protein CheW [Paenibacillus sp. MMS20-IR301]